MKTLTILIATILISSVAFGDEQPPQEQVTLDSLLNRYEQQQQKAPQPTDPQAEVRKLRSQIIDLRVERDALSEENNYLKNKLENLQAFEESHPECLEQECVPIKEVEEERIVSYVIYSLSMYRMAEAVVQNTPLENVEAHKQAQRVMAGVKSDLDTLGFDTTDMQDYPSLDELLKEFQIAYKRAK